MRVAALSPFIVHIGVMVSEVREVMLAELGYGLGHRVVELRMKSRKI
jgi:hypothetical protein